LDNGPELISLILAEWAEQHRVTLEFINLDLRSLRTGLDLGLIGYQLSVFGQRFYLTDCLSGKTVTLPEQSPYNRTLVELSDAVTDRLFARPAGLYGEEFELVRKLSDHLAKEYPVLRSAAFVTLDAMLQLEGARMILSPSVGLLRRFIGSNSLGRNRIR
jgi:hypothetical protein